jgi:prolyl oligopeptidase
LLTKLALAGSAALFAAAAAPAKDDPFLWLEEVEGAKALDWVRAENAASLAVLESDPRFAAMVDEAKQILNSSARIPDGEIHNGRVYNFWQDATHVRGLWRRADLKSYKSGAPEWEILIDYDRLAAEEGRNWIHGAIVCLSPAFVHCMIELSDGGKDAAYWREFNTETKSFVEGGFALAEGKSSVGWIDPDRLLVGADLGPGTLTTSGYPKAVRLWERGEAVSDAAVFVEGDETDVSVYPQVFQGEGGAHVIANRAIGFFDSEYYYAPNGEGAPTKLPLPTKSDLIGVLDGEAILLLREPWSSGGVEFPSGVLIAYDLKSGAASTAFAPSANQAIDDGSVAIGENSVIVRYLEDVSGRAARLVRDKKSGEWTARPIPLPDNGVIKIVSAGGGTDDALFTYESVTTPNALYLVTAKNKIKKIMQAPEFYDSAGVAVEQRFATSKDGTRIPYYVIGQKEVIEAGNAPTIQYGYGGFLNPILPVYYEDPARPQHGALAGRLWISRGGVLVLSNIRGGSEYGPSWHAAALKENRQKSFDDFIAISEALIESGLTSPQKLGAIGRSNGGLLMGAVLTQRPDLYAALDIGVPLFDMKRYNKLLAGASWMGEYGNPDIPEEWAYISQYSPYQKLETGKPYPKTFFYTSTKDDRVHPGHARKAVAKLKALGYPVLYYENIEGGHGGTANQDQLAYRTALEFAYFAHMLMPAQAARN